MITEKEIEELTSNMEEHLKKIKEKIETLEKSKNTEQDLKDLEELEKAGNLDVLEKLDKEIDSISTDLEELKYLYDKDDGKDLKGEIDSKQNELKSLKEDHHNRVFLSSDIKNLEEEISFLESIQSDIETKKNKIEELKGEKSRIEYLKGRSEELKQVRAQEKTRQKTLRSFKLMKDKFEALKFNINQKGISPEVFNKNKSLYTMLINEHAIFNRFIVLQDLIKEHKNANNADFNEINKYLRSLSSGFEVNSNNINNLEDFEYFCTEIEGPKHGLDHKQEEPKQEGPESYSMKSPTYYDGAKSAISDKGLSELKENVNEIVNAYINYKKKQKESINNFMRLLWRRDDNRIKMAESFLEEIKSATNKTQIEELLQGEKFKKISKKINEKNIITSEKIEVNKLLGRDTKASAKKLDKPSNNSNLGGG